MPWTETCVIKERAKFIMEVLDGTYSMAELCSYYRLSRKTEFFSNQASSAMVLSPFAVARATLTLKAAL